MREKILVVDDEQEIADLVTLYLQSENYEVLKYYTAREALECIRKEAPDMAILDVMMPEINGFQLCRIIREQHTYPVVMLTAKGEEIDKINGLTLGADDYITKPFRPLELIARVKAQLRRAEYKQSPSQAQLIKIGAITIDPDGCRIMKDNREIELTAREFEILHYLAQNTGRVISRERLYETVWGEDSFGCDNTIMVHIRHLREKLESDPAAPEYIITMKGLGYKLVNPYEKQTKI